MGVIAVLLCYRDSFEMCLFLQLHQNQNVVVTLFLVSGDTQKYQKCRLLRQINDPVISFSHIETRD